MSSLPDETEGDAPPSSPPRAVVIPLARPVPPDAVLPDRPRLVARPVQRLPMPMSRLRAFVELALVTSAFFFGLVVTVLVLHFVKLSDERWMYLATTIGGAFGAMLMCFLLLGFAGHKPLTIGWTGEQWLFNIAIGIAVLMLTYVVLFTVGMIILILYPGFLDQRFQAQEAFKQAFPPTSWGALILIVGFVPVWEEVVLRGFALTRLQAIFKRWWLTVPIGAVLFGLLHCYEGAIGVAAIIALALVMGVLLAWRKSLVPSVVFHLLNNLLFVLVIRMSSSTLQ